MEVKAEDFTNNNENFSNVRFEIVNGGLTIEPKAITVTALSYTISFGEGAPEYDIDQNDLLSQLCGDDDVSVIVYHLGCDYSKDKDGNALVGVHDIVFQNPQEDQGNYKVSFVPGTLTVTAPDPQDFDYVTKNHADNDYYPGDTITYSIKVNNIFNVPATVRITEQNGVTLEGAVGGVLTDTLEAGKIGTYTATYVVDREDLDDNFKFTNTVNVTITPNGGSGGSPVEDSATDEETINVPSLLVKKRIISADQDGDGKYDLGEVIKYTISVTNNGNVPVHGIALSDAMDIGGTEKVPENWQDKTIVMLDPGETSYFQYEYTVKEEDLGGKTIVNTATATGSDPRDEDVVGEGDVETETEERNPHMTAAKAVTNSGSGENGEFKLGETIQYKITLTNDGNVTLSSVSFRDYFGVTEDITTLVGEDITAKLTPVGEFNNVLEPNESAEFTYSYEVQEEDLGKVVVNEVTSPFAVDDKDVPAVVDDEAVKVTSDVEDPNPNLDVEKKEVSTPANGKTYALGEEIRYEITVSNTGNVTLTGINVVDVLKDQDGVEIGNLPLAGASDLTLSPVNHGESSKTIEVAYKVTEDDLGKTLYNTATATATQTVLDPENPGQEKPVTDEDTTEGEDTDVPNPDMTVEKEVVAPKASYQVGDVITYRITVTNTGNTTLHDLDLTDTMNAIGKVTFKDLGAGKLSGTRVVLDSLPPQMNNVWVVTCQYVVQEGDAGKTISNSARVISHDDEDKPEQDEEDITEGEPVEELYTLTIKYQNGNRVDIADSFTVRLHAGQRFSQASPAVAGYHLADGTDRIVSGTMPANDLTLVVIYAANPAEDDDEPAGPVVNPDQDDEEEPDDEAVDEVEPGIYVEDPDDYTLTPIEDDETPLADMDVGEHTCCIMHFLLMVAAMVVLGFYTKSRKKHQARIFELKRTLAMEQDHPEGDDPQQS